MLIDITLTLILATLFGIRRCLGDQTCSRNDCTLPATENRGPIDCSITALRGENWYTTASSHFPPKPEQVNVKVYRLGKNVQFNVTWQPGSNDSIQYLEGYSITIGDNFSQKIAYFEMKFTNKSQVFIPDKDGQLVLYSDCSVYGGLSINDAYPVFIESLPKTKLPETIIIQMKIIPCEDFSVSNGNVSPFPKSYIPGDVVNSYIPGDVVNVTCLGKYKLDGASTRTCLDKGTGRGQWNVPKPKCIESKVEVETFSNHSALVKFDTLPTCYKYTVRLRDLTYDHQLQKYAKDTGELSHMYQNLTVGNWEACVSCDKQKETCSKSFTIYDLPASTTPRVTTRSDTTTHVVSNSSTMTFRYNTLTSKPTNPIVGNNLLNDAAAYIYSIVGCVGGIILVTLVYILKGGRQGTFVHSPLQEQDESPSLTASSTQSSIAEIDVCSEIQSEDTSHLDTVTIMSGPVGEINIVPDGCV